MEKLIKEFFNKNILIAFISGLFIYKVLFSIEIQSAFIRTSQTILTVKLAMMTTKTNFYKIIPIIILISLFAVKFR